MNGGGNEEQLRLVATVVDGFSAPLKEFIAQLKAATQQVNQTRTVMGQAEKSAGSFSGRVSQSKTAIDQMGRSISQVGNQFKQVLTPALSAAGISAGSASLAFVALTKSMSDLGESTANLDRFSRSTGVAFESVRQLTEAGKRFGVSAQETEAGLRALTRNLTLWRSVWGGDFVKMIGTSDIAIQNFVRSLHSVGDPTKGLEKIFNFAKTVTVRRLPGDKTPVSQFEKNEAQRIFLSRFGLPENYQYIMQEYLKDEKQFKDVMEALGLTPLTKKEMKAAGDYQASLQKLRTEFTNLKNEVGAQLYPELEKLATKFREWMEQHRGKLADDVVAFWKDMAAVARVLAKMATGIDTVVTAMGGWQAAILTIMGLGFLKWIWGAYAAVRGLAGAMGLIRPAGVAAAEGIAAATAAGAGGGAIAAGSKAAAATLGAVSAASRYRLGATLLGGLSLALTPNLWDRKDWEERMRKRGGPWRTPREVPLPRSRPPEADLPPGATLLPEMNVTAPPPIRRDRGVVPIYTGPSERMQELYRQFEAEKLRPPRSAELPGTISPDQSLLGPKINEDRREFERSFEDSTYKGVLDALKDYFGIDGPANGIRGALGGGFAPGGEFGPGAGPRPGGGGGARGGAGMGGDQPGGSEQTTTGSGPSQTGQGETKPSFANVRFNNPGAMYPGKAASMFGSTGTGHIGGGHLIANFPTPVHGAAANMQNITSGGYVGMRVGDAIRKWSGGGRGEVPGFGAGQVITSQMAHDPKFMIPFMKAVASGEAPGRYPMDDAQWAQAFKWYQAGGVPKGEAALGRGGAKSAGGLAAQSGLGDIPQGSGSLDPRRMDPMASAGGAVGRGISTTTIVTPHGRKLQVDSRFAANFQRFVNSYEEAGGIVGPSSGGLSGRPENASYHPLGRAIDVNQVARDVRSGGRSLPKDVEDRIALESGLYPGSRFTGGKGPDTGHFEVRNAALAFAKQSEWAGGKVAAGDLAAQAGAKDVGGGGALAKGDMSAVAFMQARGGHTAGEGAAPFSHDLATRLKSAAEDYEKQTGRRANFGEMSRSHERQAEYYRRYKAGTGGIAAAPGHGRHERGAATDIPRGPFLEWMHQHGGQYGVNFPVRGDPVHAQLINDPQAGTVTGGGPDGGGGAGGSPGGGGGGGGGGGPCGCGPGGGFGGMGGGLGGLLGSALSHLGGGKLGGMGGLLGGLLGGGGGGGLLGGLLHGGGMVGGGHGSPFMGTGGLMGGIFGGGGAGRAFGEIPQLTNMLRQQQQQKVEGDASLRIDLNGFPRGTKTATGMGGMFKQLNLNRGKSVTAEDNP